VEVALRWKRRVPEDADGIVCVGEDEAEHWKKLRGNVLWLPNGVDTALFAGHRPTPGGAPRKGGAFRVVCVARIDRQKGQMALVEALGRHPRMVVRLVGPTTQPDYLEALQGRARELGAEGRLEVAGALPPGSPELAAEFGRADAFVLPSRHEPFGIAVLEAWASGVPVAASTAGGMGRLLERHPGAALSFAPGDAAGLDAALERLETDGEWRKSAAAAGREAAKRYEWGALAAELVDFYRSLG
jgi:glycosyltransferase involved in cell wall biosynthesis